MAVGSNGEPFRPLTDFVFISTRYPHTLLDLALTFTCVGDALATDHPPKRQVHGTAGRRPIILTWRCLLLSWHLRPLTGPLGHLFLFPDRRFDLGHPLLMCPLPYSSKVANFPSCEYPVTLDSEGESLLLIQLINDCWWAFPLMYLQWWSIVLLISSRCIWNCARPVSLRSPLV